MTEFKGILGKYKIIETEDKTETVWSEYFNEACHNLSGAYEETIHNYILGCSIPDLIARKKGFAVLDVGFGVGIGLKALMDRMAQASIKQNVNYYSIELDEELLQWSLNKTLPGLSLERKVLAGNNLICYRGTWNEHLKIQIFVGDGRVTLPLAHASKLISPIDAIFQDAFSPKKNPTLWSTEWFLFLKDISAPNVQLATYSSSISIRKSLIGAGWSIENARGFALKRTMTRANLTGTTSPELILQLSRSPSLEIKDK
ncbi:MAG: MnmC family methyltransferase [Bacteriovorax sp.]